MTNQTTPNLDALVERLHPLTGPLIDLRQVIHPLTQQGEDRIWRAAEKACKLIDKAETEREQLRTTLTTLSDKNAKLVEALVAHNDALRSACAVADRDGKETNWLTLRGRIHWVLAEHHETTNDARQTLNEGVQP